MDSEPNVSSTRVCVRLRPASAKETGVRCVSCAGDSDISFRNPDASLSVFGFDKVYGKPSLQPFKFISDC